MSLEGSHNQVWEAWVEQYSAQLLLYARQQVGYLPEAEDLVQEAMIESWRRKGGDEPPPLPLVYATIRRRAIDRNRAASRRRQREEAAGSESPAWFVSDVGAGDRADKLQFYLQELPGEQREVLVMKIWGGLTFQEIATALEIPMFTAASRYRYAVEALRKKVGDDI